MDRLTEANIRHIRKFWTLKNKEDTKWTDYYFNGGDMPNENYIPFLETEYRNYLTKLNINPNDRTLDEDLWLFINFGTIEFKIDLHTVNCCCSHKTFLTTFLLQPMPICTCNLEKIELYK